MKILIVTQYFPPEIGAPQNRLFELAVRLKAKGAEIDVLTAMPNYPQAKIHDNYKGLRFFKEEMQGLQVFRSWIFVSEKQSIINRLLNYFSFVFSSLHYGYFKTQKRYDYILCESPPLFLGISAWFLSYFKKAKLIFNVSDLWPETAEKLGIITNRFFLYSATILEEFLYKKSFLVSGQTQGIVDNIKQRFPKKEVYWLPNGVDVNWISNAEIKFNWREKNGFLKEDFVLFYGGIIGHAQGLEVILKAAELLRNNTQIKFVLQGSGPELDKLKALKTSLDLNSVYFLEAVAKNEMPSVLSGIDAAIIPLKKLDLFKGAIPSKIFETMAMKKPILLGVEGEAKHHFIDNAKAGLAFEPENEEDLSNKILQLIDQKSQMFEKGENGYQYVKKHFNRDIIAQDLFQFLESRLKS